MMIDKTAETAFAKQLAAYARDTPGFVFYTQIDGDYRHIGATVADAILQANNNYKTNVKPRVLRVLERYPEVTTTSSLHALLNNTSVAEFLNWRGADRAERFLQVLALFAAERVETQDDLKAWLLRDDNLPKLRAIKGIGPKTIDYFKILVGISTSAIDRHLLGFLELAGIAGCSYAEAQSIINATADLLDQSRACFDHSIWQYMSQRAAAPRVSHCIKQ